MIFVFTVALGVFFLPLTRAVPSFTQPLICLTRTSTIRMLYTDVQYAQAPITPLTLVSILFSEFSRGLKFISELGLFPVPWEIVCEADLLSAINESEALIANYPYPTDGLVVVLNDLDICKTLGCTARVPRYAKAFKWADELYETVLRGVEWSVSENGLVSPVAIFDPVEIDGTTVKRAGLHNVTNVQKLALGIGDRITVYKAGKIIPQVYESLDKGNSIIFPQVCPGCGGRLERRLGVNGKTEFLYCTTDWPTEGH